MVAKHLGWRPDDEGPRFELHNVGEGTARNTKLVVKVGVGDDRSAPIPEAGFSAAEIDFESGPHAITVGECVEAAIFAKISGARMIPRARHGQNYVARWNLTYSDVFGEEFTDERAIPGIAD